MRALTLTQPWAGLVASGVKLVENRPRRMIKTEDFGKPFAIHASKVIDPSVYETIQKLSPAIGGVGHATGWWALSRITSAVIGVATIEGVATNLHELEEIWHDTPNAFPWQKRWFFGPIGYALCHVRALTEPVPCRGALGFWTLQADVAARVEEQLR
jgi:hypothetical protein